MRGGKLLAIGGESEFSVVRGRGLHSQGRFQGGSGSGSGSLGLGFGLGLGLGLGAGACGGERRLQGGCIGCALAGIDVGGLAPDGVNFRTAFG